MNTVYKLNNCNRNTLQRSAFPDDRMAVPPATSGEADMRTTETESKQA